MATVILIIVSVVFIALIIWGFLVFLKEHEAEPLTPEQVEEIRKNYEKKDNYTSSDDFMDSTIYAGAGIIGNSNGIADDFWNL